MQRENLTASTVLYKYPGVTSFRRYKEQYYISVRHMHALSKEIEHMYKYNTYVQSQMIMSAYFIPNPFKT